MIGGTRRHLTNIVHGLDKRRFETVVICSTLRSPSCDSDITEFRRKGIEVFIVPMTREIRPLSDLVAFFKIFFILKSKEFDILHAHSSKAGFLGRIAARLAGVPVVLYTPHAFFYQAKLPPLQKWFYTLLERIAGGFMDKLVAISTGEKRAAIEAKICTESMVEVIPNGIDPETFNCKRTKALIKKELSITETHPVVGTVARFCPQKGHAVLIEAAGKVLEACPQTRFLMIGRGELKEKMAAYSQSRGLSNNITILNGRSDLYDLYSIMDVFVLPSLWEGMPYALLEAMASGTPVIATTVLQDEGLVVNGKNGFLVPPGNPDMLARSIVSLLNDKSLAASMGREGLRVVRRRFHLKHQIEKLEELYSGMVHSKGCESFPQSKNSGPIL